MCGDSKALTEAEDQKGAKRTLEIERRKEWRALSGRQATSKQRLQMFLAYKCVQEWPKAWTRPQNWTVLQHMMDR